MLKLKKIIFILFLTSFSSSPGSLAYSEGGLAAGVKIGVLLPLTGQFAPVGSDALQGIEIAKTEVDPKNQVNFIFSDSKGESNVAVNEFRRLSSIEKVLGAYVFRGPIGMTLNPISKNLKLPLFGGVANQNFALSNEYAFQLWARADQEGETLAEGMIERSQKKIAIVTSQDDYLIALSKGLKDKIKSLKGVLCYDEEILPNENDFRVLITKIKNTNADAIFVNVGISQIAPFLKQLKEMEVFTQVYSNFWASKNDVINASEDAIENLMFVEMSTDYSKLRMDLKERYKSTPSAATVSAYVATNLFVQALKDLKQVNTSKLYEKLLSIEEINTANGNFKVVNRFVQFPLKLKRIKNKNVEDL